MAATDESLIDETRFFERIDAEIDRFATERVSIVSPLGDDVVAFARAATEFVTGGKRLRASFLRAGWIAAGGSADSEPMVQAATAIELLQGSALVHDDLMDGSDTRRGRPSIHREFEARHRAQQRVGDPSWFGQATAVLMGDLLLSWSNELVVNATATVAPERGRKAIALYDLCKTEVTAGQFLDVVAQTKPEVSVDDAMTVARYKSAKYTVERPLQIGAALAGADDTLLDQLSAVALPLGVAFQLRDDVLGVFGDPEVTGKPAGDDLREGKRTVLVARAMELSDESGRNLLAAALGTDSGVDVAREHIRSSGALDAIENDIAQLESQTEDAINDLDPSAVAILRPLAVKAVRRAR